MSGPLVWLDLETTGLNPSSDSILEVAMVATDGDLKQIEGAPDPLNYVLTGKNALNLNNWDSAVVEMHARSGLIAECRRSLTERSSANKRINDWLIALGRAVGMEIMPMGKLVEKNEANDSLKFVMAGSTIDFDRRFYAQAGWPMQFFHYRTINVSSVKELVRRWYGENALYEVPSEKAHRALPDIRESIAELAYYRSNFFVVASPNKTAGGK